MAQQVKNLACLCGIGGLIPGLVQWVNDPSLLQLRCMSQLQFEFDPWPWELPYAINTTKYIYIKIPYTQWYKEYAGVMITISERK